MARAVKCKATGEIGTNETFYRPEDGTKFYFKDKETYEKWAEEKSTKKVRCFVTKEYGTNKTFYRPEDEQFSNHWFKSKEVYDNWRNDVEKTKAINEMIANFTGYYDGQVFPTIVPRKIKELKEVYGLDTIYETFVEKEKDIQYAMDAKEFNTDLHKCSYIMAIIANNINDVWNRKKREEKNKVKEEVELNSPDLDFEFMPRPITPKNNRDISQFLEDDLWN